jgi:NAD(P)-dependent dehydrogenase (short-subunit alcohol dehydrogenase family)
VSAGDPFSLEGRTALVTGASRGIGAAIARSLDAAGARLVLTARSEDGLAETAAGLARPAILIAADLSDEDAPARLAGETLERAGGVDVLVNNAAEAVRMPSRDLDARIVDRLYALNVRAPLLLTVALVPAMIARGGGSVVNLSSISGVTGTPGRSAYAATKGAIDAMTRSLAMEYGPSGVRVNAVAPGVVTTRMWERNRAIPGVIERVADQTALRRWGEPEEVADVVRFLAGDAARYVTAQTISVDGGMAHTLDLYGGAVSGDPPDG